jgi:hypothetical protein
MCGCSVTSAQTSACISNFIITSQNGGSDSDIPIISVIIFAFCGTLLGYAGRTAFLLSLYSDMLYGRIKCGRNPKARLLSSQIATTVANTTEGALTTPADEDGEIAAISAMNADILLDVIRVQMRMVILSLACFIMYVVTIEGDAGVQQMVRKHTILNQCCIVHD